MMSLSFLGYRRAARFSTHPDFRNSWLANLQLEGLGGETKGTIFSCAEDIVGAAGRKSRQQSFQITTGSETLCFLIVSLSLVFPAFNSYCDRPRRESLVRTP